MINLLSIILIFSLPLFASSSKIGSITKITQNSSKTSISLCANVDKYFYARDNKVAKPYVKITPNHPFTLNLSYNGICVKGLKPRTEYRVNIYKDIPLDNIKLNKDYSLVGTTGDYEASVSFPDRGYILPRKGKISIPIETLNIDKLSISLYRINRNNLIDSINSHGMIRALNSYKINDIAKKDGYFLWNKRLKIENRVNQTHTTAIRVGEFLKTRKSGIYILTAKMIDSNDNEIYEYDIPSQWFMISDIGLYTLKSDRGVDIFTKKLSSAKVYNSVKLELISKNNEILGTTITKNGKAFFDIKLFKGKRGLTPKAIYAYGKNSDFSVLDFSKPSHDLSDRGVKGRDNSAYYDAFIYSNRDIYRPSESLIFHALVRDKKGKAQSNINLSLKLFDSRRVEVYSKMVKTDKLGDITDTIDISSSSSSGRWNLSLYAGSKNPISTFSFLVEDFVPSKIKIDIKENIKTIKPDKNNTIEIEAKYLTGEPLANANIKINTILYKYKKSFKGYEKYIFGDFRDNFSNSNLALQLSKTDQNGYAKIVLNIKDKIKTSLPIYAHIDISVNELGGRPAHRIINKLYEHNLGYIGIKPNFKRDSIDMDSNPIFDLIYLKNQKLSYKKLNYKIIKEKINWNWRSSGDSWNYYKSYQDSETIIKGELFSSSTKAIELKVKKLDWGTYRLEIEDTKGIISTYRFSSGYEESISRSSPDRLPIAIDKKVYRVGDRLRVNIKSKFTGEALISIANHNIIKTKTLHLKIGESKEIEFIVDDSWGSSAYVLATAFRGQTKRLGANRAIGIAHIKIAHPEQKIELSINHKPKTSSLSKVKITLQSKDIKNIETKFTLSLVDEGILNLTNYQSPNPTKYFFGQQKLGIEIRDIYGNLITPKGAYSKFNVGSDSRLKLKVNDGVVANKREIVALFTKSISFDKNGKAEVYIDIPDYQGLLKVTAIAWNMNAVGTVTSQIIVKDKISSEFYMPKFISIDDEVETLLNIDFDKSLKKGTYQISLTAQGTVSVSPNIFNFNLTDNILNFKQKIFMKANNYNGNLEDGVITLEVLKDNQVVASKEWKIGVRTKYPQAYIRELGILKRGEAINPKKVVKDIWSNINSASLKISSKPLLNISSIKDELISYKGRCAEQTTSRAFAWLNNPNKENRELIKEAIDRVLNYQKLNGSFGLWQNSSSDMWLTAYILDFLTEAKNNQFEIPKINIEKGLDWLENNLNRWSRKSDKQEADAYALYVLTNSSRVLMSELKYHAKSRYSKINSSQAWGQLGASLAFVGEQKLAKKMFTYAKKSIKRADYDNYGATLRNEIALILLMKESNLNLDWQSHLINLSLHLKKQTYLSTQEMSLLQRVSYLISNSSSNLRLYINNKRRYIKNSEYIVDKKDIEKLPKIKNRGYGDIWYTLSFKATPLAEYYKASNNRGFNIRKNIYTMDGKKVDNNHFKAGDRFVVVIEGEITNKYIQNPLITDWIISGFEIENPNILGIDTINSLSWLKGLTPKEHREYRNDRFESAIKTDKDNKYKEAYIVQAVTRGSFALAPAKIEDMYQPQYRAFSRFIKSKIYIGKKNIKKSSDKLEEIDYLLAYKRPIKDMSRYDIVELNVIRNSIFAHAGLDFEKSNPSLHNRFIQFNWYKQETIYSGRIYSKLTTQQKNNIQILLKEEKKRAGGLVLADFYRIHIKYLSYEYLSKYSKKSLRILRNSLFARYGFNFKTIAPQLEDIFKNMPWYKPTDITGREIFTNRMNKFERENLEMILEVEDTKY